MTNHELINDYWESDLNIELKTNNIVIIFKNDYDNLGESTKRKMEILPIDKHDLKATLIADNIEENYDINYHFSKNEAIKVFDEIKKEEKKLFQKETKAFITMNDEIFIQGVLLNNDIFNENMTEYICFYKEYEEHPLFANFSTNELISPNDKKYKDIEIDLLKTSLIKTLEKMPQKDISDIVDFHNIEEFGNNNDKDHIISYILETKKKINFIEFDNMCNELAKKTGITKVDQEEFNKLAQNQNQRMKIK